MITLTPLDYNMTRQAVLADMEKWQFRLGLVGEPFQERKAKRSR